MVKCDKCHKAFKTVQGMLGHVRAIHEGKAAPGNPFIVGLREKQQRIEDTLARHEDILTRLSEEQGIQELGDELIQVINPRQAEAILKEPSRQLSFGAVAGLVALGIWVMSYSGKSEAPAGFHWQKIGIRRQLVADTG